MHIVLAHTHTCTHTHAHAHAHAHTHTRTRAHTQIIYIYIHPNSIKVFCIKSILFNFYVIDLSTKTKKSNVFTVNGTFAHIPITHAVCSAAPPYHDRRLLLHLSLMNVWMVPLVFGTENSKSIFPGNKLKRGLMFVLVHSTHFHCLFDYLR